MPWKAIDTVRCERCDVFTPTDDLRSAADGTTYCTTCGPPPARTTARLRLRLPRSPVAVAAAICAGLFAAFVALVELAT